jgi:hypothetical protein
VEDVGLKLDHFIFKHFKPRVGDLVAVGPPDVDADAAGQSKLENVES